MSPAGTPHGRASGGIPLSRCDPAPPARDPGAGILAPRVIYVQEAAVGRRRTAQILQQFPDVTVIPVRSHWQIPELHGDERLLPRWVRIKHDATVIAVLGSPRVRPNGRSAGLHSAVTIERLCHGLRLLLCAAPQRATAIRSRCSPTSSRLPLEPRVRKRVGGRIGVDTAEARGLSRRGPVLRKTLVGPWRRGFLRNPREGSLGFGLPDLLLRSGESSRS